MKITLLPAVLLLVSAGCKMPEETIVCSSKMKIGRFFVWESPNVEKSAERFAEAGATDVVCDSRKQLDLATKYGMRVYWKCFTPAGPWQQVMSPEEEAHYNYINGKDRDPKMFRAERQTIIDRRRVEKKHQYGGEPITDPDTLNAPIQCFASDAGFAMSAKKLDKILENVPEGVSGIFVDYIGYMNHHGCYCDSCVRHCKEYLKDRKLADTQENKDIFYRDQLVGYYNKVFDYVKRKRPGFKVVVHVYPDFIPEHLFGNRIKADFCGQTVAWYFKWPADKIGNYTRYVVEHARDYYPDVEGIPFLG